LTGFVTPPRVPYTYSTVRPTDKRGVIVIQGKGDRPVAPTETHTPMTHLTPFRTPA